MPLGMYNAMLGQQAMGGGAFPPPPGWQSGPQWPPDPSPVPPLGGFGQVYNENSSPMQRFLEFQKEAEREREALRQQQEAEAAVREAAKQQRMRELQNIQLRARDPRVLEREVATEIADDPRFQINPLTSSTLNLRNPGFGRREALGIRPEDAARLAREAEQRQRNLGWDRSRDLKRPTGAPEGTTVTVTMDEIDAGHSGKAESRAAFQARLRRAIRREDDYQSHLGKDREYHAKRSRGEDALSPGYLSVDAPSAADYFEPGDLVAQAGPDRMTFAEYDKVMAARREKAASDRAERKDRSRLLLEARARGISPTRLWAERRLTGGRDQSVGGIADAGSENQSSSGSALLQAEMDRTLAESTSPEYAKLIVAQRGRMDEQQALIAGRAGVAETQAAAQERASRFGVTTRAGTAAKGLEAEVAEAGFKRQQETDVIDLKAQRVEEAKAAEREWQRDPGNPDAQRNLAIAKRELTELEAIEKQQKLLDQLAAGGGTESQWAVSGKVSPDVSEAKKLVEILGTTQGLLSPEKMKSIVERLTKPRGTQTEVAPEGLHSRSFPVGSPKPSKYADYMKTRLLAGDDPDDIEQDGLRLYGNVDTSGWVQGEYNAETQMLRGARALRREGVPTEHLPSALRLVEKLRATPRRAKSRSPELIARYARSLLLEGLPEDVVEKIMRAVDPMFDSWGFSE